MLQSIQCSLLVCCLFLPQFTSLTILTRLGNVTGLSNNIYGQIVHKFLGIPYAEPPTGDRRYTKPVLQNVSFASKGFDATQLPASCPQYVYNNLARFENENCLTLNIHTSFFDNSTKLKPVMIWIHGGGFNIGSAAEYPADMLTAFANVVVVTINYRLGVLGFLTTGKPNLPGNYGLFDQKLAIEWVKKNIEDYSGDPNKITLFGESAGAVSVSYQAFSPLNNASLFQKIIIQSGSAFTLLYPNRDPMRFMMPVLTATGCDIDSMDLVQCLQQKSMAEILKAGHAGEMGLWFPIVDDDFLSHELDHLYGNFTVKGMTHDLGAKCGNLADYGMLGGWNDQDGLFYISHILQGFGFTENISEGVTEEELKNALQLIPFFYQPQGDKNNPLSDVYRLFYQANPQPGISFDRGLQFQRLEWFAELTGDVVLKLPTLMNLKLHQAISSQPAYGYEFAHRRSWKSLIGYNGPDWLRTGADHEDEIPFVFGWPLLADELRANPNIVIPEMAIENVRKLLTHQYTQEEIQLSRDMMTSWTNFVKTGSPNTTLPNRQWEAYSLTEGHRVALINTTNNIMLEYPLRERLQLYEAMLVADRTSTQSANVGVAICQLNVFWFVFHLVFVFCVHPFRI